MSARPSRPGAQAWVPSGADLDVLAAAAAECAGCELREKATQVVFGAGPPGAELVLVGEQPGDAEDRVGQPFVGPAGRVLARGLEAVGVDVHEVYLTNAVKHFSFVERGKRRIHRTPQAGQVTACLPWLHAELAVLRPRVVVVLGATAGRALLGPDFRVTGARGRLLPFPSERRIGSDPRTVSVLPTVHPSAVLRAEDFEPAFQAFVADLQVAADALATASPARERA